MFYHLDKINSLQLCLLTNENFSSAASLYLSNLHRLFTPNEHECSIMPCVLSRFQGRSVGLQINPELYEGAFISEAQCQSRAIENPRENPEAQCLILRNNTATDFQEKRLPGREYRIRVKTLQNSFFAAWLNFFNHGLAYSIFIMQLEVM